MFVSVHDVVGALLDRRSGDAGKTFAAGAGAFVLVDGLVESAWVPERVAGTGLAATVNPATWPSPHRLFLQEASVSGDGKRGVDSRSTPVIDRESTTASNVHDAATVVMAFVRKGWPSLEHSDINVERALAFNTLPPTW